MLDAHNSNSLQALQAEIIGQLFSSERHQSLSSSSIVSTTTLNAAARLQIYQHNVNANFSGALAGLFPVVKQIVGDAFFQELVRCYVRDVPSRSGDLNQFGEEFSSYIATYSYAADLPYLSDVARLEWCWHMSFHAADSITIDATAFQAIAEEKWPALKFSLSAPVKLLMSPFPLLQIWLAHQDDFDNSWQIDWSAVTTYFLLSRVDGEVVIRELQYAQYAFLKALPFNSSLQNSVDAAVMAAEQSAQPFDLLQSMQDFFVAGVFCRIEIPD